MINEEQTIQLYNEHCIGLEQKVRIYGQYHPIALGKKKAKSLRLTDSKGQKIRQKIKLSSKRHDFFIVIKRSDLERVKEYQLRLVSDIIFDNLKLHFPFDSIPLKPGETAITTMLQNYGNRVAEWIDYHLKIGFSKIIIFDNNSTDSTAKIINLLKDDRVSIIPFNYVAINPKPPYVWEDYQRIQLCIGFDVLKSYYQWVALIDADEFIYIPDQKPVGIGKFLNQRKYRLFRAITMQSILLTNKNDHDEIENNILDLCRFTSLEPKYTKIILNSKRARYLKFIKSPHQIKGQRLMPMDKIYHAHCWANERLDYSSDFVEKSGLLNLKCSP